MASVSVFKLFLLIFSSTAILISTPVSGQLGYGGLGNNAAGLGANNGLGLNGLGLNGLGLDGLGLGFNGLGFGGGNQQPVANNANNGLGYGLGEFLSLVCILGFDPC